MCKPLPSAVVFEGRLKLKTASSCSTASYLTFVDMSQGGCFCNPGACAKFIELSTMEIQENFEVLLASSIE